MSAAEFALFIFLVAGALPGLLDLHFVMRELRRSLCRRRGDFTRCQGLTLVRAASAAEFALTSVIVSEVSEIATASASAEGQTKSLTAKIAKNAAEVAENCGCLSLRLCGVLATFAVKALLSLFGAACSALTRPGQPRLCSNSRLSRARGRGAAESQVAPHA